MAYDGSGNYSLPPGSIVSDGTTIDAADHNIPVTDIAAALSQVLLRSGVAPMTGDLNMGGFSIIGVGGTNPVLGGDNAWTGSNSWSGANYMTTTTTQGTPLELSSTNDDALVGPILSLYRNPPTATSADFGGAIFFYGKDSGGTKTGYASISVNFTDVTNTSEDGRLLFSTAVAGAFATRATIGAGVYHPSATGTDKGNNTINFGAVYQNGTAVATLGANTFTSTQTFQTTGAIPIQVIRTDCTDGGPAVNMQTFTGGPAANISCGIISSQIILAAGHTTYGTSSDERLKSELRPLDDSGAILDQLQPVYFRWGPESADGPEDFGFSAQALHAVVPQAVIPGTGNPGEEGFVPWMREHGRLEAILVAEIKALRARVAALEAAAGI